VDHQLRRTTLIGRLDELQIDALLITRLPNARYLTGFTGSNAQALVRSGGCMFFSDGRYGEQARREVDGVERVTYLETFDAALAEACARAPIARLGFEANAVTVRQLDRWNEALPDVELVPVGEEVEVLRQAKDTEELDMLRRAQAVTDQAFDDLLEFLALGRTERQVAFELERLLRRGGADGLAFAPIVAFGESAAEPHHEPGHRVLDEGDVIKLDFGAELGGYHTDMTRTVAFGEPAAELKKVHDLVRQAQEAGIDAVRAGVNGAEVDLAARSVIEEAGYGQAFSHGLGHGVGLEIHEGPWLGRGRDEQALPVGAVVTIEPGIYLPGLGGVRIEDMVEVTDDGCRVLGAATRDLIEL
jgi:Xaa-Pro aminopeptidase